MSRRALQLPPLIVEQLTRYKVEQKVHSLALGVPWAAEQYVFCTKNGRLTDASNDRKIWLSILDRAGVRKVRLHAARHTADIYGHVPGVTVGSAIDAVTTLLVS